MTSETFEMKQENKLGSQSLYKTITMEWTTKTPNHYAKI